MEKQPNSRKCFVCGIDNAIGLPGESRQLTPDSRAQRRARRHTLWPSPPGQHQQVAGTDNRKMRGSPIYRIKAITSIL
jgi:hypothetical protein